MLVQVVEAFWSFTEDERCSSSQSEAKKIGCNSTTTPAPGGGETGNEVLRRICESFEILVMYFKKWQTQELSRMLPWSSILCENAFTNEGKPCAAS